MTEVNELIKQAKALFENKQYNNIIDLLPDEVLNYYNNADLYSWRAWAHSRIKQADTAFEYAEKAVIAEPDNPSGYYQRGGVWYEKGDYDWAISDFDKAIELQNDNPRVYVSRGYSWHHKGEYDKAIADYNRALEFKNDFAYAYSARGFTLIALKEYDRAIIDYDKAIEIKNDDVFSYDNRGFILTEKEDYNKAIADFNMSIKLVPEGAYAYRNRGKAFYALGDFKRAIEDFQKAIELDKRYNFLEKNIKLAKEKQDERNILEERKIELNDKIEKLKIEKEIEIQIDTIRKLSKSDVKMVVHYTKVNVANIYVNNIRAKMHYSNAIYMNDPMEGMVFFDYLNDKSIETAYLNGEKRTETSVYLGSFLPADENDGEFSHEDELVMWRTYGKDENGKEAAGCSVVLSSDFFKMVAAKKDESFTSDISEELLNVVYIKKMRHQKKVTNDPKGKIETAIKSLKMQLKLIIELRDKYQLKDDFYKDIENTIFKQLSTISYLFKSADYDFEHEVRVITYMPRDSESIKYSENIEPNAPHKRFYIESYNDILTYVKKIFLGPKVENYQQWSLYFDYEIRQRARELVEENDPPYYLKPSDIEIMKSECKFQ